MSKAAIMWLDAMVSILSSTERALSQHGTVMTHYNTSQIHSPDAAIHGWALCPKNWHSGSTNSVKAGIFPAEVKKPEQSCLISPC